MTFGTSVFGAVTPGAPETTTYGPVSVVIPMEASATMALSPTLSTTAVVYGAGSGQMTLAFSIPTYPIAVAMTASGVMAMALTGGTQSVAIQAAMSASAVMAMNPPTNTSFIDTIDFVASSFFDLVIPIERSIDPALGRQPYRLVVVDSAGTRYAELENARINTIGWALTDFGVSDFDLPTDDPKIVECQVPQREIQVWRGTQLIWWGVLIRARGDDKTVNFQAVSLEWYFTRRVIGTGAVNLLKNGNFESGEAYWNFSFLPGSSPAYAPMHSVQRNRVLSGKKSLKLGGTKNGIHADTISGDVNFAFDSSTLTAAGNSAVDSITTAATGDSPSITVVGHTDNVGTSDYNQDLSERRAASVRARILSVKPKAKVRAYGEGETDPVDTNTTALGRAANRRAVITYITTTVLNGHKQYAGQTVTYKNPVSSGRVIPLTLVGWVFIEAFAGPAANGWGLYVERVNPATNKAISTFVGITEETPVSRWVRMECSIDVPADSIDYTINVRLFPPNGITYWDEVSLTEAAALNFNKVDQALIVKGLVTHAQSVAAGKSSLNIGSITPLTGVIRTRSYLYSEHERIDECLNEFVTLSNGLDWFVDYTPVNRTVRTFHPRRGRDTPVVLALGSNILNFSVDIDGDQTSTAIIVQAEGEGSDREEGYARDDTPLGGLVLEKVYNATPGSSVSSLQAQADRGLFRYSNPVTIPTITSMPDATDELLSVLKVGDRAVVDIKKGWIQAYGRYRITNITLDPNTEQITYGIVPEDKFSATGVPG